MDISKELINLLTPLLKQMNFNKRGNNFYIQLSRNYGVVNFQKSRDNTRDVLLFTINFGIYSDILGQFEIGYNNTVKPEVEQCQWRARVGAFMPNSTDYWWKVNLSDNLNNISLNVVEVIRNIVLPEINKRLTDEGLIKFWLTEGFAGTTEIGKFKYLTTLLKAKEDFDTLKQVVETFTQKSSQMPIER